ncbi:hypothetical protein FACS189451_04080 [Bacteroidia bacterium]|nr:hypothetical protein FACS189446_1880 [Bacteroidia bacterium]GHT61629.1 hypothetical protein FACS189451_04080 [Bacteroidia bacterium]
MRRIKSKIVQVHFECVCGYNDVYQDGLPIRWKDFHKEGIIRKKDKKTGKPFLLMLVKSEECSGHADNFND